MLDSGSATSDGVLTLSGNAQCVVMAGYDAPVGTEKITESNDKTDPRTVALVNEKGEINTTTALTNFANENNPRSATSSECTKIWVGGNGNKTTGGVNFAKLGRNNGDPAQRSRQERPRGAGRRRPAVHLRGPDKAGRPHDRHSRQRAADNQRTDDHQPAFRNGQAPEEPYGYSLLTLGSGSTPGHAVRRRREGGETGAIVKYGLSGGKWVEHGSVEVPAR